MIQEPVHIFGREVSKAVFDLIAVLSGAFVGGLIAFLATWLSDNRRWRREQALRQQEARRRAIEAPLEWIIPLMVELNHMESEKKALREGSMTPDRYYHGRRSSFSRIAIKKLPESAAVHYPSDAFYRIIDLLQTTHRLTPPEKFNGPHKEYVEWADSVFEEDKFPEKVRSVYDDLVKEHDSLTQVKIK